MRWVRVSSRAQWHNSLIWAIGVIACCVSFDLDRGEGVALATLTFALLPWSPD